MLKGSADGAFEIGARRHVADRVVHEDAVEGAPEPDRPHVALDVLALRVEAAAHRKHGGREVDERAGQKRLQVGGVVATTAAEVEKSARRPATVSFEQTAVEGGLLGVVAHWGQQGIPVGEVAVEPELLSNG